MSRRPHAALVASPVLVGAVTLLVACVSVLLAVKANSGLPFVPTYDLRAELPGGNNLVVGNEVRLGGFRVGVVDKIRPGIASSPDEEDRAEQRAIAIVDMKLDKRVEELPRDTHLLVRPRSDSPGSISTYLSPSAERGRITRVESTGSGSTCFSSFS